MPEVCRNRSWIVIGRFSGTSSSLPLFSTPTFWSENSGMYLAIGSLSRKWPSSSSIMMPTETIGLVMEKMRNRVLCAIGAGLAGILPAERLEPADLAAARDHHGHARRGSLVDVALERVRHPLQPDGARARAIPVWPGGGAGSAGRRGVWRRFARSWSLSLLLLLLAGSISSGYGQVWRRTLGLNRALTASPLQSGRWPMLETARISGDAWFPQGCSSVGRVPVSKTGCRRFEPCRPCQFPPTLTFRRVRST